MLHQSEAGKHAGKESTQNGWPTGALESLVDAALGEWTRPAAHPAPPQARVKSDTAAGPSTAASGGSVQDRAGSPNTRPQEGAHTSRASGSSTVRFASPPQSLPAPQQPLPTSPMGATPLPKPAAHNVASRLPHPHQGSAASAKFTHQPVIQQHPRDTPKPDKPENHHSAPSVGDSSSSEDADPADPEALPQPPQPKRSSSRRTSAPVQATAPEPGAPVVVHVPTRNPQHRAMRICGGCSQEKRRVYRYVGAKKPFCNACNQHWRRHIHSCRLCDTLEALGASEELRGIELGEVRRTMPISAIQRTAAAAPAHPVPERPTQINVGNDHASQRPTPRRPGTLEDILHAAESTTASNVRTGSGSSPAEGEQSAPARGQVATTSPPDS
eukprot:TRINITY_DN5559_c0_g1_i1.p1 TRINITY_DN5559_c0_g1~~TRINITY_DN5559_c0_g1_i1.p1  ORF type:complete len:385 (+),score=33.53 TRINITY_DN5559_c0_g1_i1:212-1366(+)